MQQPTHYSRRRFLACMVLAGVAALPAAGARAQVAAAAQAEPNLRIGVLHARPARSDERETYQAIVDGLEDLLDRNVPQFTLDADPEARQAALDWLRRREIDQALVLGLRALKGLPEIPADENIRLIFGSVPIVPERYVRDTRVLSTSPAPDLLLRQLKALRPQAERVFFINDNDLNAWLLALARQSAAELELELVVINETSRDDAARAYIDVLSRADPLRDAVWLPDVSVALNDRDVLTGILQRSWRHNVVLFSGNRLHVERGALFALYQDSRDVAEELVAAARNPNGPRVGITPAPARRLAMNLRTAAHLNIDIDANLEQQIDLRYPLR